MNPAPPLRAERGTKLTTEELCQWLRYLHCLKRELPTAYPVAVRTCRVPHSVCGDALLVRQGRRARFRVRIGHSLSWLERVETLVHEYAHCLNWSHRHDTLGADYHDDSWGVWYAKAYRVIEACDA